MSPILNNNGDCFVLKVASKLYNLHASSFGACPYCSIVFLDGWMRISDLSSYLR